MLARAHGSRRPTAPPRGRGVAGWLSPAVVEVVTADLVVPASERRGLEGLLSPAERARADRFRAASDRDAFVVARGRLRQVLGVATGRRPDEVELVAEPGGKPRLGDPAHAVLRFSLSHAAGLMLCALALGRDVGVDVERVDRAGAVAEVAGRVFTDAERRALLALPAAARGAALVAGWTRKEAVVKATGEGLGRSLLSFRVSLDPDRAAMLGADPALGEAARWLLASVPVPAAYRATVAVRDGRDRVAVRATTWPELLARLAGAE